MTICFYGPDDKHGYLANFSRHPIAMGGIVWSTVEHFFHAQKFILCKEVFEAILIADSPAKAKQIGKKFRERRRSDWRAIRQGVMKMAIEAKFLQHPDLAMNLLATDKRMIVEQANDDWYWGCGYNGRGLNVMGRIIMQVRNQLQNKSLF
jgi:ribA/ribD-fused uncharacterized protein